jgi:hypothetical protein
MVSQSTAKILDAFWKLALNRCYAIGSAKIPKDTDITGFSLQALRRLKYENEMKKIHFI